MSPRLVTNCNAVLGLTGLTLSMFWNLKFCNTRIVTLCPSYNAVAKPVELVPLEPVVLNCNSRTF